MHVFSFYKWFKDSIKMDVVLLFFKEKYKLLLKVKIQSSSSTVSVCTESQSIIKLLNKDDVSQFTDSVNSNSEPNSSCVLYIDH